MRKLFFFVLVSLCVSAPAWATITKVQADGKTTASGTTITCKLNTQNIAVGNLIVMKWKAANSSRAFSSATDDNSDGISNGWAQDGTDLSWAGGTMGSFSAVVTHAGSTAVTITLNLSGGASGGGDATCTEYNSTNNWPASHANFYDQMVTGTCNSSCTATAVSSTTLTAAQTSELLDGYYRANAARTVNSSDLTTATFPTFATSQVDHGAFLASTSYNATVSIVVSSAPANWTWMVTAYKDNATTGVAKRRSGGIY